MREPQDGPTSRLKLQSAGNPSIRKLKSASRLFKTSSAQGLKTSSFRISGFQAFKIPSPHSKAPQVSSRCKQNPQALKTSSTPQDIKTQTAKAASRRAPKSWQLQARSAARAISQREDDRRKIYSPSVCCAVPCTASTPHRDVRYLRRVFAIAFKCKIYFLPLPYILMQRKKTKLLR
jgi:hypothetical protein